MSGTAMNRGNGRRGELIMTIAGYILWGAIIVIALMSVAGFIIELYEWGKDEIITRHERKKYGK